MTRMDRTSVWFFRDAQQWQTSKRHIFAQQSLSDSLSPSPFQFYSLLAADIIVYFFLGFTFLTSQVLDDGYKNDAHAW